MLIIRFIMLIIVTISVTPMAKAAQGPWLETEFAKMRLISASQTAGTSGDISLGLEMQLEEGWKTYWRTPGDAGLAPVISLDPIAMAGARASLKFPLPKRFTLFGLDTFGYGRRVVFPIDLTLVDRAQAGAISIQIEALICADICVPVSGSVKLSLPQGAQSPSLYGQELAMIHAKLPKFEPSSLRVYDAPPALDPDNLGHLLVLLDEPLQVRDMIVEGAPGASYGVPEKTGDKRYLIKQIAPSYKGDTTSKVTITVDSTARAFETSLLVQETASLSSAAPAKARALPFWLIALIGGFILNFMPCVLPVLSLKVASILALRKSTATPRHVRIRFLASAAGIIVSFVLLAGFLHGLRSAGGQVGWGIQFQSPLFLTLLLAVTILFTASLFGLISLRLPAFVSARLPARDKADTPRLWGDFGAGMLATLLATPCSAPFVGTAVSFALSQSTITLYAMLVMMGVGLALPWLLLAIFPRLITILPKPGQWMVNLQKGLGVLMALTVLWVASLLYNALPVGQKSASDTADTSWIAYDSALLDELRSQDKLVFVDVTADWCITCKANKALVLNTTATRTLFAENNVVQMQADWTLPDEAIARFLASHQRFGIPFNVIYGKGAKEGLILPEILSLSAVKNAIAQANQ